MPKRPDKRRRRKVFKLHLAGLSNAAIAGQVGCNPVTVARDLVLAEEELEQILSDELRTVGIEAIEGLRFVTTQAIEELRKDSALKTELVAAINPEGETEEERSRRAAQLMLADILKQKPADLLREISNAADRMAEIAGLKIKRLGGEKPGEAIQIENKGQASVPEFLAFLRGIVDRVDPDLIGK